MKSFLNYAKNRFLYNLLRLAIVFGLGLLVSQFLFIPKVNAQVIEYQFMGTTVNNSFSVGANSNSSARTYFVVSADSTAKYLVVDLCSTAGTSFSTSVSSNYDGSSTSFHEIYDLNKSCSTGSYNGNTVRLFYLISNFADSGNGNMAINNTMQFTNNVGYSAIFKLISIGLSDTIDLGDLTINNQNTIINNINNINTSISNTEENIKNEINEMEENINNNFNTCRESKNLLNLSAPYSYTAHWSVANDIGFYYSADSWSNVIWYLPIKSGTTYTFSYKQRPSTSIYLGFREVDSNSNLLKSLAEDFTGTTLTFTATNTGYLMLFINNSNPVDQLLFEEMMFAEGSSNYTYEPYGKEICQNKIDATNDKLDQAEETRKGILGKIGDLISYINPLSENFFVYKLIELLLDALKSLFIPKDGFFSEWFDEFMAYVELKLGFLSTPFTLFIDFVESYLNLSSSTDVIINIPDISVPNFEDNILIHATSFNWSETLRSKDSLNTLWQLYLDFIDVFLILNFIGLCESTYNRIFGGNTANYEYYTVEDSYTYDNNTGEVLSSRRNERTTKRKRGGS